MRLMKILTILICSTIDKYLEKFREKFTKEIKENVEFVDQKTICTLITFCRIQKEDLLRSQQISNYFVPDTTYKKVQNFNEKD